METMDQREAIYEAQQAAQLITSMGHLSPDEVQLIRQHREKKEYRRKQIIQCIDATITANTHRCSTDWSGWPGTSTITRAVFEALVSKGYINDAN